MRPTHLALLPVVLMTAGCESCDDRSPYYPANDEAAAPAAPPKPPSVDSISIPNWPPLGPQGVVRADVSDDCCLSEVRFTFANFVTFPVSGTHDAVSVTGDELGEGLGTLYVDALDGEGTWATRMVTDLLVDLSPPNAQLGDTVLRADGSGNGAELEVWVGDAWVLGSVELAFQGVSKAHTFPEVYPSTLGSDWDHSLETFPTSDFPAGSGPATLTVRDAAGNAAVTTFDLLIDGTPPLVAIASPAPGAVLSGPFEVGIDASDGEGPVTIELRVGGAPVATATGPEATVTLDASDFVPGPSELVAVAIDIAGNEGISDPIPIVIE